MSHKHSSAMLYGAIFVGLFTGLFADAFLTPYLPTGLLGAFIGFAVAAAVIYIFIGFAQGKPPKQLRLFDMGCRVKQLAVLKRLASFSPIPATFRFASA